MKIKLILGVLGILTVLTWGLIWWEGSKSSCVAAMVTPKVEIPSGLTVSVIGFSEQGRNVIIRFENHTREPIRLLRPLDGSLWGWLMPIYDLSITDDQGTQVPLYPRCGVFGLYASMKWPDDYRVQVLPGDAYEMKVSTNRALRESVAYTVSFRYQYKPKEKKAEGKSYINYPGDLWAGEVTSAVKQLQFVAAVPVSTK